MSSIRRAFCFGVSVFLAAAGPVQARPPALQFHGAIEAVELSAAASPKASSLPDDQFAIPSDQRIDVIGHGQWIETLSSGAVERALVYSLRVPGAKTLSLRFSELSLPGGARMLVQSPNGSGQSFYEGDLARPELWTWPQPGDTLQLIVWGLPEKGDNASLVIDRVFVGYREPFSSDDVNAKAGNCSLGGGASSATSRIIVSSVAACTASLVSHSDSFSTTPKILTAGHCNKGPATSVQVIWGYASGCTPSDPVYGVQSLYYEAPAVGARDVWLLSLEKYPDAGVNAYAAGVTTSAAPPAIVQAGYAYHHASGGLMESYSARHQYTRNGPTNGGYTFDYQYYWSPTQETAGGSSGAGFYSSSAAVEGLVVAGGPLRTDAPDFPGTGPKTSTSIIQPLAGAPLGLSPIGQPAPRPAPPTVAFELTPATVTSGGAVTATWTSSNASACIASGAWSGIKALSGSQSFSVPANTSTTNTTASYTLTCSGSGGDSTVTGTVTVRPALPILNVRVTSQSPVVANGSQTAEVRWDATGAASCAASGDWSGSKAIGSGRNESVGPFTTAGQRSYTLTCTNAGGNSSDTANLQVEPEPLPAVAISASPATVRVGQQSTLTWSSTNVTGNCVASGNWSGNKSANGTQAVGPFNSVGLRTFNLECSNGAGETRSASTQVSITADATPTPSPTPSSTPSSTPTFTPTSSATPTATPTPTAGALSMTFSASRTALITTQNVTLTWSSNGGLCQPGGDDLWAQTGDKGPSGSAVIGPFGSPGIKTLSLQCYQNATPSGQSVSHSIALTVSGSTSTPRPTPTPATEIPKPTSSPSSTPSTSPTVRPSSTPTPTSSQTSAPTPTVQPSLAPSPGVATAVTLDPRGQEVVLTLNGGTIERFARASPPVGREAEFPAGYYVLEVENLSPGSTATAIIDFPPDTNIADYLRCAGAECDFLDGVVISGRAVTLQLVDGGEADTDGVANGRFRFAGGPEIVQSSGGGGAVGVWNIVPLLGFAWIRRRAIRRRGPCGLTA
ncbi:MAG: hypothetical protein M3O62_04130 [Pseudomonadota bacterium]|nr:hypothetical protein [Pseudomonadota bacterium]